MKYITCYIDSICLVDVALLFGQAHKRIQSGA